MTSRCSICHKPCRNLYHDRCLLKLVPGSRLWLAWQLTLSRMRLALSVARCMLAEFVAEVKIAAAQLPWGS